MHLFRVLGWIVDNYLSKKANTLYRDENEVIVGVDDMNKINMIVKTLIDDDCYIGDYCKAKFVFRKNPQNSRGELCVLIFIDKNGNSISVEVGSTILAILCTDENDEPYYQECDTIFFLANS